MGEGETTEWPDNDADPFADAESDPKSPAVEEEMPSELPQAEENEEVLADEGPAMIGSELAPLASNYDEWKLPIRAAPLLHQFHNEVVTEYPLLQTMDGRQATSLVVDDDLLRIIESRLDDDGQRRLKVSLSMKREITGFKHQHNELMHNHQFLWLGSAVFGIVFLLSSLPVFNFLGVLLVAAGVWNWTSMHLESHHLEFTNSGGTLSHTLRGYGTNRPFFRASMALLGSEMAGLLRNGTLETEALDILHKVLATPPVKPTPPPAALPMPVQPVPVEQTPAIPVPQQIPAPPQAVPQAKASMSGPPTAPPPPSTAPPPPTPLAAPLPPPLAAVPPTPLAAPLPPPLAVPPTPLPPPQPLPPLNGPGGMPLPPLGLPVDPLPLDAPLPNAPEIAVKASPVEDTLSEKEQSDLLSELS